MKTKPNPFAHWGIDDTLSPFAEGKRREQAIIEGLRALAESEGKTFREPLHINSAGEILLSVSNGTANDGRGDFCGEFGKRIADLLNRSEGARVGIGITVHQSPQNGWCMLNHFAAQKILEEANQL